MNNNSLVLAYLGDAYFELFIRSYIVSLNDLKVKDLQKIVTSIVSAKGQANLLNKLIDDNKINEELQRRKKHCNTRGSDGHCSRYM